MESTSAHPEGPKWRCEVCLRVVRAPVSSRGDATCPRCGSLAWLPLPGREADRLISLLTALGGQWDYDFDAKSWEVDLTGRSVSAKALSELDHCGPIEELLLNETAVDDAGLACLSAMTSLAVLELHATRVTDAGVASLRKLKRLEMLCFSQTRVGDEGMRPLASLPILWWLDLAGTEIGIPSLSTLAAMRLEALDLSQTKLGDDAVPVLQRFHQLEELELQQTRFSRRGVGQIRAALPRCAIGW